MGIFLRTPNWLIPLCLYSFIRNVVITLSMQSIRPESMVKVHYAMKSQTSWDEATHAAHPIKNVVSCSLCSFIALTSTCRGDVPACCYSFSYREFGSYPSMLTLVLASSIGNESAYNNSFLSQHKIAPCHVNAIAPTWNQISGILSVRPSPAYEC